MVSSISTSNMDFESGFGKMHRDVGEHQARKSTLNQSDSQQHDIQLSDCGKLKSAFASLEMASEAFTVLEYRNINASKINNFVHAYNHLMVTLYACTDQESAMPALHNHLLETFHSGKDKSLSALAQIGITMQEDGALRVDEAILKEAIRLDAKHVTQVFSHDNRGIADRFLHFTHDNLHKDAADI
jgi:flagellar capping protein FliD